MGDFTGIEDILSNPTAVRKGHTPHTSLLFAAASKSLGDDGDGIGGGFATAEGLSGVEEADAVLAEKYSSVASDIPRGIISQFIEPSEAVPLQTMVNEDIAKGSLTTELGADALNPKSPYLEKTVNLVSEFYRKQGVDTTTGDWFKTILIPERDQALLLNIFGTANAEALTNFAANWAASEPKQQHDLLQTLITKMNKVEGYDLEKAAMVTDILDGFSNQDAGLINLFGGMGLFDVAAIGKGAVSLVKAGGVSRTLLRAGEVEEAGKAAAGALSDPTVAKRNNEDVDSLVSNIISNDRVDTYLAGTETLTELNGGNKVVTDAQEFNNTVVAEITETVDSLLLSENYQASDLNAMLDESNFKGVAPLKQDFWKKFDETKIRLANNGVAPVPTAEILSQNLNDGTMRVKFSINGKVRGTKINKDGSPSKRGDVQHNVDYSETQTISLHNNIHATLENIHSDTGSVSRLAASPNYKFRTVNGTTANRIVENLGLDDRAAAVLVDKIQGSYYDILKTAGVHKKGKRRELFEKALSKADDGDELLSPDQLLNDHMLNPKEATAYYNINRLLDITKSMEDHARYRKAFQNGTKRIDINKQTFTGRVFKNEKHAMEELKKAQYVTAEGRIIVDNIYDSTTNAYVPLDRVNWDDKVLTILDDDVVVKLSDGNTRNTQVIITGSENIGELDPKSFLNFNRKSYVPIYRPNAKYFVKETAIRMVDNIEIEYERTAAGFDNKIDAEDFLAKRHSDHASNSIMLKNGKVDTSIRSIDTEVSYDRESLMSGSGREDMRTSTKARSNKNTIEWHGVSDSTRMSPIEAIGRNMSIAARNHATAEWKNSIMTKWRKSVAEFDHDGNINNPVNTNTPKGRNLEEVRLYIKSKLGIPSSETMAWENFTRRVAEFTDVWSPGNSTALSRGIRRAGNHDPYSLIKYTAFQSMLGFLNPAQLWVQAQNLTMSLSMFPGLTAGTMKRTFATGWFMNLDAASLKTLGKDGVISGETLDTIKQFKRAGLDNITTNADVDIAMAGFGVTATAYKKGLESGLFFYRRGEMAARSVAFNVARAKYMKDNNISSYKSLVETDHRRIVELFDDLSFNLNSNNKARFQEGILSIPTQFWHVQTKFLETLAGKSFTGKEKMKLVVGQMMLYGAAGVPMGYALADLLQKRDPEGSGKVLGFSSEDLKGGLINYAFSSATGTGLQLSQRGALAYGLEGYVKGLFQDDNKELWEKAMGASSQLFKRGSYAFDVLSAFAFEPDEVVNETDLLDVIKALTSITSTGGNALTALDMHAFGKYRDRYSGRINFRDPTLVEIFGKGLGISSTREATMWEDAMELRAYTKWKTETTDKFFRLMFAQNIDPTSYEAGKWLNKTVPAYASLFSGGEEHTSKVIAKSIFKKLKRLKGKSKEEAVLDGIIKHISSSDLAELRVQEEE